MKLDKKIFDEKTLLLYGVTDRSWLCGKSLEDVVRESLEGGVTFLQIREKHLCDEEFLEETLKLKKLCKEYNVPLVVNDNIQVAIRSDVDGVHIGQDDMSAKEVRKLIGKDKIMGVSAQTVEQALSAEEQGADYLGVGAVFPTSSKSDAKTIDFELFKEICKAVKIPVVAIGGITKDNIKALKNSGAKGVALISAIYAQPDIKAATDEIKSILVDF